MHQIVINDIVIDVVRKDIKNLHLSVHPPNGRVRAAVPLCVEDDAVRLAVISKLAWIKRQRETFQKQERQTKRQYISGESHYFQGNRYLLNVVYSDEESGVRIRNKKIMDLIVCRGSDTVQRCNTLTDWYRQQLKQEIPALVDKWETILGVHVNEWRVKQMKTKWGSCNIEARRIWINLELIKKPIQCLEYIIVHEIVHLLERQHNERFTALMDKFLPNWRLLREELNREPLAYENWDY